MSMGVREYARHRGVSHTAVEKAIRSGRISIESDGSIDDVKADAAWDRNTNPAQQRKLDPVPGKSVPTPLKPHSPPVRQHIPQPVADQEVGPSGAAVPNYQMSRAIREAYNAKLARIDFEERMGKLVDRAEVITSAFDNGRKIRDRIMSIPSRISAVVAAAAPGTDIMEVERLLSAELLSSLEELTQYLKTVQQK